MTPLELTLIDKKKTKLKEKKWKLIMECLRSKIFVCGQNIRIYFYWNNRKIQHKEKTNFTQIKKIAQKASDLASPKGKRKSSYSMEFKQQVVVYAEANSNRSAALHFGVEPKRVREWKKNFLQIKSTRSGRQRLDGGGRKCNDEDLEEEVVNWIYEQWSRMLHVSRKMIMWKPKSLFDEKNDDPAVKESFIASREWCERFMRRHGFSLRRKTTAAQKDPSFMADRIVAYVMHVRRLQKQFNFRESDIIAMDETPVWSDMVSNTTVEK